MTKQRADCKAYQVSDQMTCPACRLTWDMNDPEPPLCRLGLDDMARQDVEHYVVKPRQLTIKEQLRRRFG